MGWASLLKAAFRLGGRATKATFSTMGSAALHPQQTLRGMGTAVKSATVGGALGYIGWEKLTTDKSVVGIVSDAVIKESRISSPIQISINSSVLRPNIPNHPILSVEQPRN